MINKELHTTSPLRRKRNIYSVFCNCAFLANRDRPSLGSLCILFMESLSERDCEPCMAVKFCRELRPFIEYIERHGITVATALERRHVAAYVTFVRTVYEAGEKTFTDTLDANGLLSAVRLFCQYLYSTGVVAQDYGLSVPVISFPDTVE